jgi:hypothetical protein
MPIPCAILAQGGSVLVFRFVCVLIGYAGLFLQCGVRRLAWELLGLSVAVVETVQQRGYGAVGVVRTEALLHPASQEAALG